MSTDRPSHAVPLTDERWARLVSPLRRYFPKGGAEQDLEQTFRMHVFELVALFRDKNSSFEKWLPRLEPLLKAVKEATPRNDDPLMQNLTVSLCYTQSARGWGPPRPALALKRLRCVQRQAEALSSGMAAILNDPWLDLAGSIEIQTSVQRTLRESPVLPDDVDADSVVEELFLKGEAPFAAIKYVLSETVQVLPHIAEVARVGVAMLAGGQFKGRPREGGGNLPCLLLAALTKRYAPPPRRGRRGHHAADLWREVVTDFVRGVLIEARLPAGPREYLEANLRSR
jgi:hypothetical protein